MSIAFLLIIGLTYSLAVSEGDDFISQIDRLHLVELAILFAAVGYVTQLALDATGKSRTSKTLRTENEDLVRRNDELTRDVSHLRREVERLETDVKVLRAQLDELSQRDQKAVLAALDLHEERAGKRWDGTLSVLTDIRDVLKEGAT